MIGRQGMNNDLKDDGPIVQDAAGESLSTMQKQIDNLAKLCVVLVENQIIEHHASTLNPASSIFQALP